MSVIRSCSDDELNAGEGRHRPATTERIFAAKANIPTSRDRSQSTVSSPLKSPMPAGTGGGWSLAMACMAVWPRTRSSCRPPTSVTDCGDSSASVRGGVPVSTISGTNPLPPPMPAWETMVVGDQFNAPALVAAYVEGLGNGAGQAPKSRVE